MCSAILWEDFQGKWLYSVLSCAFTIKPTFGVKCGATDKPDQQDRGTKEVFQLYALAILSFLCHWSFPLLMLFLFYDVGLLIVSAKCGLAVGHILFQGILWLCFLLVRANFLCFFSSPKYFSQAIALQQCLTNLSIYFERLLSLNLTVFQGKTGT